MPERERDSTFQIGTGTIISGSTIEVGGDYIPFSRAIGRDIDPQEKEFKTSCRRLHEQIEEYFDLVAETLHDNPRLQDEMLKRLQNAKEMLQNMEDDPEGGLSQAQFEVRRVHVAISKEQQIERGEKRLSWVVPTLVILYVAAIIAIVVLGSSVWTTNTQVPIIGIPVSVLTWAAVGSLAAILYRFYTRRRGRVSREIRWLIARPIVGIIMGGLSYLAVVSGLLIFGTATGSEPNAPTTRPQLLWILLAFLSGFSDKIFKAIIELVAGKISNTDKEASTDQNSE